MKRTKQLLSLLLALVLALSLVSPALAAETDDASGVTADTLTQLLGQAPTFPEGASASDGITNQEAAAALLLHVAGSRAGSRKTGCPAGFAGTDAPKRYSDGGKL